MPYHHDLMTPKDLNSNLNTLMGRFYCMNVWRPIHVVQHMWVHIYTHTQTPHFLTPFCTPMCGLWLVATYFSSAQPLLTTSDPSYREKCKSTFMTKATTFYSLGNLLSTFPVDFISCVLSFGLDKPSEFPLHSYSLTLITV